MRELMNFLDWWKDTTLSKEAAYHCLRRMDLEEMPEHLTREIHSAILEIIQG